MKFGSLIDYNLFDVDLPKGLLSPLMFKGERKHFSVLESPVTNLYTGEVSYKLFLCGKSSTGKTSLINNACGRTVQPTSETTGIQTTNVFWPVRINETKATVLFKLSFWDVGESVLNSYNHILPACMENVDGVIYVFSLISKSTWEDLPRLITRIDAEDDILKVCVGTKLDLVSPSSLVVSSRMIKDFEQVWKFPVLKVCNINSKDDMGSGHIENCFKVSAPFLNRLCELLWYRDQVRVGLIPKVFIDFCFEDDEEELSATSYEGSGSDLIAPKGTKVTFC